MIDLGLWKNHSITDHLPHLENDIQHAFKNQQYLYSVFFDFEKVYDFAWKYGIEKSRIISFTQNFFIQVKIQMKIGNLTSTEHDLKIKPQGA